MSLTPEFLASYQLDQVTVPPTEVESNSGFRVQSFWGFDSPPQASTKDWQMGNTVQVFEPVGNGTVRLWETTAAFGVPFDVERMEQGPKMVPAFAGEDLDAEMQTLGYGAATWNPEGWPMLTYTLQPDAPTLAAILEHFRESGMDVEQVLAKR
jgi:hypothetical protein